jgi:predicted metalloprotease
MRWRRGERSSDIEDRRGQSIGGRFGAGPKLGIVRTYLTVANGRHTPGYCLAWGR